ncbi:alpha/beta hydrolase [Comamonas serinivorans]|uniref:alpha/beta hydrolase n=1 Tax=Comamonas serinivorans TaxID=1082851 RepID=UPI0012F90154|nr:alpha/beta hydrolase-fold protein [Comamonas serinivorans]
MPTGTFTATSAVPPAFRAHAEQAAAVHYLTLDSAVLGQSRSVAVSLPASYGREPGLRYPVLVLLDGPQQLAHTESLVRFLARGEVIPELLVVAVAPIDRSRELTPARVTDAPRGPGPQTATPVVGPQATHAAQTGGADDFLAFIEHELLPALDRSYRTTAWRALFGHPTAGCSVCMR